MTSRTKTTHQFSSVATLLIVTQLNHISLSIQIHIYIPTFYPRVRMATTDYGRVINFGAGPACLPDSVLVEAQKELLNYKGSGRSIMEMSHRCKIFEELIQGAENDLRKLLYVDL